MKVRIIKTPKLQTGGSVYDRYRPDLSQNLAMMNSAVGVAEGVNQMLQFAPTNLVNKGIGQLTGGIEKMFSKHPSGTTSTLPSTPTPPSIPNNVAVPGALDGLGDLGIGDIAVMAQNGGLLPNVINKPLMKDGGQTFITSQPAYTQKSYNYFGTSNAPARDSYTDNNEVNTTVKPVDEEISNIEAEKDEFIYSDQGLYKILGEKHKNGGTPLVAKGGEFIFSAHKDMSLDPKLVKEANLKTVDSKKAEDHTPAKILERNVDVKDYNRLKVIVENPKSDNITKKTAQFMLDKMDAKLKIIAELQEAKKSPNPTLIEDQYLEQPEIQLDVDQQEQFQKGGFYQNGTNDVNLFSGKQTDVNSEQSKQQAIQFEKTLRDKGYQGPSIVNLDFSKPHPEIKQAQEFAVKTFGPEIASYLRTEKPSNAVQNIIGKRDITDPKQVTDEELVKAYPDSYWSWRGYIPGQRKSADDMEPVKRDFPYLKEEEPGLKTDSLPPLPANKKYTEEVSDLDIPDPYNKIKAMQASEYANNLLSTKPYFTYASPEIQPWTVAPKQSDQAIKDQAGQANYLAARVASKLNNMPGLQQTIAKHAAVINDSLSKINQFNTQAEATNYNNNILNNAKTANRWEDKLKTTYDQNTNVLDKTNFQRAAYYNKYSEAQQRDMLNKYYGQKDLLTAELPYASSYDELNSDGTYTKRTTVPINPVTGKYNPRARLWDTNGVNQMSRKQDTIEQRVASLRKAGYTDKMIESILDKEYPDLKQSSR